MLSNAMSNWPFIYLNISKREYFTNNCFKENKNA